ncbi:MULTISPECIES: hypothetical protein [unclassified Nostoc]|uniref:hypothetical protein n=1 Tax=unclassified Nostoc TaxID=2593658 RepID=UPI00261CE887|nr:hypothetical protein [Nostoc sp. S13]MDF5735854.1 hypothetical protein [Nostoc sp. S13]
MPQALRQRYFDAAQYKSVQVPNAQYFSTRGCANDKAQYKCPMPNAQCPMPNAQCPMPNVQCPMPNTLFLSLNFC